MKGNQGPHILTAQGLLETPFLSKLLGPGTLRMKLRLLLSGPSRSCPLALFPILRFFVFSFWSKGFV